MSNKYVTLEDGMDFRTIASIMAEAGYDMNHATARNVLMSSVSKFVKVLAEDLGVNLSAYSHDLIKGTELHSALSDILFLTYENIKREGNE